VWAILSEEAKTLTPGCSCPALADVSPWAASWVFLAESARQTSCAERGKLLEPGPEQTRSPKTRCEEQIEPPRRTGGVAQVAHHCNGKPGGVSQSFTRRA